MLRLCLQRNSRMSKIEARAQIEGGVAMCRECGLLAWGKEPELSVLVQPRAGKLTGNLDNPQIHSLRTSHIFTTCVSATYSSNVISNSGQ